MRARLAAAAGVATLLILLTGCTGSPLSEPTSRGASSSAADACAAVTAGIQDAAIELQNLDVTDPQASAVTLRGAAERLAAAAAVGNDDIAALLPPLQSGFADAADILQAIAGGDLGRLAALQEATARIQTALAAFADVCAPAR